MLLDRLVGRVTSGQKLRQQAKGVKGPAIRQGDTEHSTVLHVPSIALVVGGDVVYNGVHMMTAETDEHGREAWIASLDKVAALNPKTVVAGHKSVGAPDLPDSIRASQQYLRDFSRIVNQGGDVEDIVAEMLNLHGNRDNPRTLWYSARLAVAKRVSPTGPTRGSRADVGTAMPPAWRRQTPRFPVAFEGGNRKQRDSSCLSGLASRRVLVTMTPGCSAGQ
jgi:hypothetical protein